MDFTLSIYHKLLTTLQNKGYIFQPFANFLENPAGKAVILRHDVDKLPTNSLEMARLEHELEIRGSYFFRVVKESWDEVIMRQIASMGHEIGYHYEDLSLTGGDHKKAITHFETQLARLQEIYPVNTICMHGSPLSKHDNRDLWQHYNYRDYGIIGEPYFDLDFDNVFYLTDTGRRWDGHRVSVRDKTSQTFGNNACTGELPVEVQGRASLLQWPQQYRTTHHIITAALENRLPNQIMITVHPQRWTDKPLPWHWEPVWQDVKNVGKRVVIARR